MARQSPGIDMNAMLDARSTAAKAALSIFDAHGKLLAGRAVKHECLFAWQEIADSGLFFNGTDRVASCDIYPFCPPLSCHWPAAAANIHAVLGCATAQRRLTRAVTP